MRRGTTITNYLVSGDPEGIIFSYMSNWTGQAIKVPRNLFAEAKDLPDLNKPGIYFLIGTDEQNPDDKMIYSGEANNLSQRIAQHLSTPEKSFCDVIICFSSKDENLTVSHTKYLEEKIITHLSSSREYRMINSKNGNTVSLPRMVQDEMDTYYDNMKILLPTLGYHVLHLAESIMSSKQQRKASLFLNVSDSKASGVLTSNGLLVLKGSEMSPTAVPSLSNSYIMMRSSLIEKGIVKSGRAGLKFIEDYEFASPSTAAAVILGYSTNGRTAWKYENGDSIKDAEMKLLREELAKRARAILEKRKKEEDRN